MRTTLVIWIIFVGLLALLNSALLIGNIDAHKYGWAFLNITAIVMNIWTIKYRVEEFREAQQ